MEDAAPKPAPPRPAPSGKREQTKCQNRQTILDAARRVFAELGYGATTVRDIIRATPLASGTFYNYFKSKEEVYQAIRDEVALAIRPRLREVRIKAATIEEFVYGNFHIFFDYVASRRTNVILRNADNSRVRFDTPEILAGFDELREDIEKAIARGLFPPIDAGYLAAALAGAANEISEYMVLQKTSDPAETAKIATALFMSGIGALPVKAPAEAPAAPEIH